MDQTQVDLISLDRFMDPRVEYLECTNPCVEKKNQHNKMKAAANKIYFRISKAA